MNSLVGLILNHREKTLEFVTSPYYQSKEIVCATNIYNEEVACRPGDMFILPNFNSKQDFFETVRDSFRAPIVLAVKSTYQTLPFSILNGVCVLHLSSEEKYSIQFYFEKGLKLNDKIKLIYDPSTASYKVSTDNYLRRIARYDSTKIPQGESFDRIRTVLKDYGRLTNGLTTAEIATILDLTENRVSGRISEMRRCGLIHKCGTKTTPEGRTQSIWALTKKYD